nr:ZPR1 zinc finger domain-containing protein [Candidatus Sigynarchaeota archaeon]
MSETQELYLDETCPACNSKELWIRTTTYKEPKSGDELLLMGIVCKKCGYKKSDVMPLLPSVHASGKRHILTIEEPVDLESKLFRSPTATIEIPELEISLEPGTNADFFLTNVERILLKFKEICEYMRKDLEDEGRKVILNNKISQIDRLMKVMEKFTLILEDPEKFSYITPAREKTLKIDDRVSGE